MPKVRPFNQSFGALVGWSLLALWFAYVLSACGTTAVVEGDDMGVALAADELLAPPVGGPHFGYRPHFQPGSVWLVAAGVRLTGADVFSVFAWCSMAAALLNLVLIAELVHRLAEVPRWLAGLFTLALQEAIAQCYYANTTSLAAAFLLAGLLCPTLGWRRPSVAWACAGLCFALGTWMRLDVLAAAPAVLLHLLTTRGTDRVSARLAACAGTALATFGLVALATGFDPAAAWQNIQTHKGVRFAGWQNLQCTLAFFPLPFIPAALLGGWAEVRRRSGRVLLPFLALLATLTLAFWGALSSPKYLFYLAPWLCALAAAGVQACWEQGRKGGIALIGLGVVAVGQYLAPFGSLRGVLESAGLPLGPGLPPPDESYLYTHDASRLLDGVFFAPSFWDEGKRRSAATMDRLQRAISTDAQILLASEWPAKQTAAWALRKNGFVCQPAAPQRERFSTEVFRWERSIDGRVIWLLHSPALSQDVGAALLAVGASAGAQRGLFLYSRDAAGVAASHFLQLYAAGVTWTEADEIPIEFLEMTGLRLTAP